MVIADLNFLEDGVTYEDTMSQAVATMESMVEDHFTPEVIIEVADWCENNIDLVEPDEQELLLKTIAESRETARKRAENPVP